MSTLADPGRFARVMFGGSMIGAALFMLGSSLAWPPIKSDDAAQLAVIAQHPTRFYLCTILILVSSMLFVPALIGLMRRSAERSPRLANLGGALSVLGALVAVGDSTTQLVIWQMVGRGAERSQMAALLHRYDNATGASIVFNVGGIAIVVGIALLSIALYRSRAVPAWAAIGLVAGTVLNIVGFSASSVGILIVSSVILLVSLGWIGLKELRGELFHGAHGAPRAGSDELLDPVQV